MSGWYPWLKWMHVISSTVLLGTGAGILFFVVRAHRTRDIKVIVAVIHDVLLANAIFTATAVVLEPLTGIAMARTVGYPASSLWIRASVLLYALVGACWLPILWLQIRMRDLARRAAADGVGLSLQYMLYYRWWQGLGWLAFTFLLAIFYLMIAKPL
jgi:uncharacterized membrane protein